MIDMTGRTERVRIPPETPAARRARRRGRAPRETVFETSATARYGANTAVKDVNIKIERT